MTSENIPGIGPVADPSAKDPGKDREMPFTAHLAELRSRLAKAVLSVIATSCLAYNWSEEIFRLITAPLREGIAALEVSPDVTSQFKLIGTGPAEAFVVKLKAAILVGVMLACPVLFYQLWKFIAPALYSNEKKFALPFVASSSIFFLMGVSFCFKLVLPIAYQFFLQEYVSIDVNPDLKIGEYLSFTIQILLVFGVVFELPVLSYFLARIGMLSHRWLIEKFRYAIVIIFIVAAILTPPDVVTQCLLAAPLTVLYGLCIIVTYFTYQPNSRGQSSSPQQN